MPEIDLTPVEDLMETLTAKQLAWCRRFAETHNATKSALQAGYAVSHAQSQGSENLRNPMLLRVVRYLRDEANRAAGIEPGDVVRRLTEIAFADPCALVQIRRTCCRYCHGVDYAYQWRTPREFNEAMQEYEALPDTVRQKKQPPNDEGGYGYRRGNPINHDCPECDGMGEPFVDVTPVEQMSRDAKILYKGAVQTQTGIKILMHDKMAALRELAKITGAYKQPDAGDTASAFATFIQDLQRQGSTPPLVTDNGDPE